MHCDDDQIVLINADLLAFINEQKGFTMTKARWERDMILAKRIMDKGTANHILVSQQVA